MCMTLDFLGSRFFRINGSLFGAAAVSSIVLLNAASGAEAGCPGDNAGLKLPDGFCATIFADEVGAPRHMAVAADGTVYVNNRSRGGGPSLLALKDSKGAGQADTIQKFGPPGEGATG